MMYETELYHFGVKGQKWGVRRYQNSDGSYKSGAEGRYDPEPHSIRGNLHRFAASGHNAQYKVLRKLHVRTAARAHQLLAQKNMRKADQADAALRQKRIDKNVRKANRERLKNVDPELAKNTVTRRVAYDYHNLNNKQFMAKYQTTKGTFAKRYAKTNGDTYSLGLKKAAAASRITAKYGDVPYFDIRSKRMRVSKGRDRAAKYLTQDILYSEIVTSAGYNDAEQKYYEQRGRR